MKNISQRWKKKEFLKYTLNYKKKKNLIKSEWYINFICQKRSELNVINE